MSDGQMTIRVHGDTYNRLTESKPDEVTVQEYVEALVPEEMEKSMTRPESDVVAIRVERSVARQVNRLAGENMTADRVINRLLDTNE